MFLVHFAVMVVVLLQLGAIPPGVEKFFQEFDCELPRLTQQVCAVSHWFGAFWYVIILAFAALDGGILVILAMAAPRQGWLAVIYSHALLLLAVVLLFVTTVGLFLPLVTSVEALAS